MGPQFLIQFRRYLQSFSNGTWWKQRAMYMETTVTTRPPPISNDQAWVTWPSLPTSDMRWIKSLMFLSQTGQCVSSVTSVSGIQVTMTVQLQKWWESNPINEAHNDYFMCLLETRFFKIKSVNFINRMSGLPLNLSSSGALYCSCFTANKNTQT